MKIFKSRLFFKGFRGITLAPIGIFVHPDAVENKQTINHEKIHWAQQMEWLIIPFYIRYFIEWIFKGYRQISFEVEAYDNDQNPDYLKTRRRFNR